MLAVLTIPSCQRTE